MKFNKKLYTMSLGTLVFGGLLASCTNELNEPTFNNPSGNDAVSLVHSPDIYIWSGGESLGGNTRSLGTRGAQPNSNEWGSGKYEDFPKPDDITDAEIQKVLAVFSEKGKESYEPLVDWDKFFVQQVWKGTASYTAGNGGTVIGGNQMDWLCCGSAEMGDDHVNNFNNASGSVMLMFDSSTKRWGYKSSTDSGHIFHYFRMEEIDGNYYVGLDFSAEGQNPNEQVQRDYIYNDWIIKIVPGKGVTNDGGDDDDDDKPGVTPPGPGTGGGTGEGEKDPILHNNEVEVNLSINDVHTDKIEGKFEQKYATADLWTKLSIHVRKGTDVRVVLPVPQKYVVESDDFAIFQKHEEGFYESTGDEKPVIHNSKESISYTVYDTTVELSIEFTSSSIIVETDGINQRLIDSLFAANGDGINFEIWLYFQTEEYRWVEDDDYVGPDNNPAGGYGEAVSKTDLNRSTLKSLLDDSTISFLDATPDYYINAFGWEYYDDIDYSNGQNSDKHKNVPRVFDCYVKPVGNFGAPVRTKHLNSTPFNDIYVRSGVTADDAHVSHASN